MFKKKVQRLLARPLSVDYPEKGFGDKRLSVRVQSSIDALEKRPGSGFPRVFGESGSEGFYRLLRNEAVDWPELLGFHISSSFSRAQSYQTILCIHDTTVFKFGGESERDGLGWVNDPNSQAGSSFFGHMALLATNTETPLPLGVGATELWTRQGEGNQKRDSSDRESARWLRLVEEVESKRPAGSLVHVMDREGESFELMNRLKQTKSRFVLRMRTGRRVADERGRDSNEVLSGLNGLCVRDVALTRRGKNASKLGPEGQKKHLPRNQRRATLEFSATSLTLKRPRRSSKTCLPLEMEINVVQVREINVPEGQQGVDWKILTGEPIHDIPSVLSVVDMYRKRWLIEEYFQAIKTGCAFEKRQLESFKTLSNALAITLPVAWKLLLLRALGRNWPEDDGLLLLSPDQIKLLRILAKRPVPEHPTVYDLTWALAGLGGHLRQNGPPGWRTIGSGLQDLLSAELGWNAAKRCDQ